MKRFFVLILLFSIFVQQILAEQLKLLPQNSELRQFVTTAARTLNPSLTVEAVFHYDKPAFFHTSSGNWDERQKLGLFNQILAVSSLAGIQYYSSSRKAMRTFYETSFIIDGPVTKRPLPDPVFSQLPASYTFFARQKDLTFGDNIYRYDCIITKDVIFFTQENITALSYGIIPAIGKGNLKSVIAIMDNGDSLLIYAVSMAKIFSVPGMGDRISSSFNSRAEAVIAWLTGRLDKEIYIHFR